MIIASQSCEDLLSYHPLHYNISVGSIYLVVSSSFDPWIPAFTISILLAPLILNVTPVDFALNILISIHSISQSLNSFVKSFSSPTGTIISLSQVPSGIVKPLQVTLASSSPPFNKVNGDRGLQRHKPRHNKTCRYRNANIYLHTYTRFS